MRECYNDQQFVMQIQPNFPQVVWRLVSRLRDYDGLFYPQNWQVLRGDEQLDAARDTWLLLDQTDFLKCL
jgi:hypothetical protein